MRDEQRRRYVAHRLCPACRRRNTEIGQRGDRLMHQVCRKWLDHGMTVRQVCNLVSDERLLAALAGDRMLTTRALIAASEMSSATALASAKRLRATGTIERLRLVNDEAGRTYLYRRVRPAQEAA